MKKRVLSLLLTLCMVLALLPTSAFAAKARFTISSVAATVDAPTAGKMPHEVAPTLSTADVNLYAYEWKDENGNNITVFESGKTYRLVILATSASKQFTSNATATVNGQTATVDECTDTTLRFYYDFTLDNIIDRVDLSVTPFYMGNTPRNISVTAAEGQHFTIRSVEITDEKDNAFSADHKFADRENVYVYVKLAADTGYAFPADYKNLSSYFDGKEGQEWPYTTDVKNVTVYMAYRAEAAATISRIDATITEPVSGAKPSFTATTDADTYTLSNVRWWELDSEKEWVADVTASDTFKPNTWYYLWIDATPADGYQFVSSASGPDGYINGVKGGTASKSVGSAVREVYKTYQTGEVPVAKALESIAITTKPIRISFTAGETFDITGMVVTATYTDKTTAQAKGYTFTPNGKLTENDKAITVSYTEGDVTKTATLNIVVSPAPHQQQPNPFTDVPNVKDYYYYDPIIWAYYHEPQITTGTSATTFDLWMTCDRGQVVTFLWRAYGCPAPQGAANNFTDLTQDWYKTAVQWAVEQGITNGTGANTFSPTKTCSVAEVITFLYRAAGSPGAAYNPLNQWYTDAMDWAFSIGLIQGTSYDGVNPLVDCPRADIVTYLYRQFGK